MPPVLPVPTLTDVEMAAAACFADTGFATSLDVKRRLRAYGFWATQALVSNALDDLSMEAAWTWTECLAWRRVPGTARFRREGPYRAYWPEGAAPSLVPYGVG